MIALIVENSLIAKSNIVNDLQKLKNVKAVMVKYDKSILNNIAKANPNVIITDVDPSPDRPFGLIQAIRNTKQLEKKEIFFVCREIGVKNEIALRKLGITRFFTYSNGTRSIVNAVLLIMKPEVEEQIDEWEKSMKNSHLKSIAANIDSKKIAEELTKIIPHNDFLKSSPVQKEIIIQKIVEKRKDADTALKTVDISSLDVQQMVGEKSKTETTLDSMFGESDTPLSHRKLLSAGLTALRANDINLAIEHLSAAAISPKLEGIANLFLGISYRKKGNIKEAVTIFQKLLKYPDKKVKFDAHYELALTFEKIKKFTQAEKIYTVIYKVDKEFKDVKQKIIKLKKLRGSA